jgi:hypothetical protein
VAVSAPPAPSAGWCSGGGRAAWPDLGCILLPAQPARQPSLLFLAALPRCCRFNLLREESEGYAKLATLLNQQGAGRLSAEGAAATVKAMQREAGAAAGCVPH